MVCWSRCRDSQTERPGGITSICPGPRNPTSCNHPSGNLSRPVGKTDRQLTDLPTPTRRKNRHDKDRMIYLTKREIEKEFHTRVLKKVDKSCGAWFPEATTDLTTVTTAAQPGRLHSDFGWQPYSNPSRRSGPTGTLPAAPESVIVGQMLSKASAYPIRSRTVPKKGAAYRQNSSDRGAQ